MHDSIEEFKDKEMDIHFEIHCARGLPQNLVNEVICKYKWIDEEAELFETPIATSKSINPDFNYTKVHKLYIDDHIIEHIWNGSLVISIYGKLSDIEIDQFKREIESSLSVAQNNTNNKEENDNNKSDTNNKSVTNNASNIASTNRSIEMKPIVTNDPNVLENEIASYYITYI